MRYAIRLHNYSKEQATYLLTYNSETWVFTNINHAHREAFDRNELYPKFRYTVEEYVE